MASNVAPSECGSEVKSQGLNEVTSNEEDIKELLRSAAAYQQNAEQAMSLAHVHAAKARIEIQLPILLTSKLMNEAFHVDPGDGHFKFCPKCGLGGRCHLSRELSYGFTSELCSHGRNSRRGMALSCMGCEKTAGNHENGWSSKVWNHNHLCQSGEGLQSK